MWRSVVSSIYNFRLGEVNSRHGNGMVDAVRRMGKGGKGSGEGTHQVQYSDPAVEVELQPEHNRTDPQSLRLVAKRLALKSGGHGVRG